MDKLELGHAAKTLHRHFRRATRSLNSAWNHTQIASFANAGIKYTSMATVDVRARAVHSGLWCKPLGWEPVPIPVRLISWRSTPTFSPSVSLQGKPEDRGSQGCLYS